MNKVSKVKRVLPIYRKQIEISDLLILFNRYDLSTAADTDASSATYNTRVEHLVSYVVSNYKLVSCFEDLKPYLEQLSFEEIKIMLDRLNAEGGKVCY